MVTPLLLSAGRSKGGAYLVGCASLVRHDAFKTVAGCEVNKTIHHPTKLLTLKTNTNATLERLTL